MIGTMGSGNIQASQEAEDRFRVCKQAFLGRGPCAESETTIVKRDDMDRPSLGRKTDEALIRDRPV